MVEVSQFFQAFGVGVVIIVLTGWIFYMLFWVYKKFGKNFKYFLRYSVFRKKISDKIVVWCMKTIDTNMSDDEVLAYLLLHDFPKEQSEEMLYIFNKCKRKLKGGKK